MQYQNSDLPCPCQLPFRACGRLVWFVSCCWTGDLLVKNLDRIFSDNPKDVTLFSSASSKWQLNDNRTTKKTEKGLWCWEHTKTRMHCIAQINTSSDGWCTVLQVVWCLGWHSTTACLELLNQSEWDDRSGVDLLWGAGRGKTGAT